MTSITRTIHDAIFKRVFSETENAESFLQTVLPSQVVARLDWGTLDRRPDSYVDETLRSKYTDLLFEVKLRAGRSACVYLLVEHQRNPDDVMAFRMLVYMTRIWEEFLVNHPGERLPMIVPVVLSQGQEGWHTATTFAELLDLEPDERDAFLGLVPDLRLLLVDLSRKSDDELRAERMVAHARALLWLMKNAGLDQRILDGLPQWHEVLWEITLKPTGADAIQTLLEYAFAASTALTSEAFDKALEEAKDPKARRVREVVVTALEKLQQKGKDEGLRLGEVKGRAEAKAEDVLAVLGARDVAVSDELRRRILGCQDLELLDRWIVRAATAKSAAEVLGE